MKTDLLKATLKDVSRSFYLTIKILPKPVRIPIGLAYLLARISDTIADTECIESAKRLEMLRVFREKVMGTGGKKILWKNLSERCEHEGESRMLLQAEEALHYLRKIQSDDSKEIRRVLDTILAGQEFDLIHFEPHAENALITPNNLPPLIPLETEEEVDEYTYSVAGCVGEFWSRVCRRNLFPDAILPFPDRHWRKLGVDFGKGLQWVNILRDIPRDLRKGRCYIPATTLRKHQLSPLHLLDPKCYQQFRPLYTQYLQQAYQLLASGWEYTLAVPFSQMRVRVACALPILLGIQTLQQLSVQNPLDPDTVIKVPRKEVKKLMRQLIFNYWFPWYWKRLFPNSWTQLLAEAE